MRFMLAFSFVAAVLVVPMVSLAAPGDIPSRLVPCNGPECNACHLVALGQNILNWLIGITVFLVAIAFAVGGLMLVMSGGNTSQRDRAKSIFSNALIGFIILMAAWLIVDTVMKTFVKGGGVLEGFGPWNQIQCVGALPPITTAPTTPGGVQVTGGCATCVTLDSSIAIKSNACSAPTCTVSDSIAGNLSQLNQNLSSAGISSSEWQITEAYPPTVTHSNPCHQNGTCVDANFVGTAPTASNINTFITQANASNLRAVYEVKTQPEKDILVAQGVPSSNIQVVSAITAPHFSVYQQ